MSKKRNSQRRSFFARESQLTDNQEGKVDPAYLAEVNRMTERRSRLHARREEALRRLAEAEAKVDEAKQTRSRAEIKRAWRIVAARQKELKEIERLMTSYSGAGSNHRGSASLRPLQSSDVVARTVDRDETRLTDGRHHPVSTRQKEER